MTVRGMASVLVTAVLLGWAPAPAHADRAQEGSDTSRASAGRPAPGKYAGTLVDDGKPNSAEWVRFRVNRKGTSVTGFSVLANMYCYNAFTFSYDILPTKIDVPAVPIKVDGTGSRGWTEPYAVDGEPYQIIGAVELKFRAGRAQRVTGRISVEFASCATTVGDAPYWTSLRAART